MNNKEIREKALELISQDRIKEAFDCLLELPNKQLKKEIIAFLQRYNSLKKEFNKGLIDYPTKQRLTNQIVNSLIESIHTDLLKVLKNSETTSEIEVLETGEDKIIITYVHHYSGSSYKLKVSPNTSTNNLLLEIRKIVEGKHKMILREKGGKALDLALFNETKERKLNPKLTIRGNNVENGDLIALMIIPK